MRALVLGASAGVGRSLSEALAARGDQLLLVASDARDLAAQAAHLRLLHGVHIETVEADASLPEQCLERVRLAADTFGRPDSLFFPIGASRPDDRGFLSLGETRRLFDVNLVSIVGVVGHFLPAMLESNQGHIVGFGSVAAVRGRRANIVYAAAKRGLESYFESLRHLTAQTGMRVQYYKLGYVATQQSFGKRLLFPQVSPQAVARAVVRDLEKAQGLIYFPGYWSLIARIVAALPWPIYKRLNF